ncbi:MAG: hypothetical protein LBH25_02210 [Fibromonadaceae bacterium]|nr:hypothetical protein [Fibromonadaceae bacterium]
MSATKSYWWRSSEFNDSIALIMFMYYGFEFAGWNGNDKGFLFSVRCLQDSP